MWRSVGWTPGAGLPIPQRLLLAGRAVWFYAAKLLVPWPLAFIYPRWELDAGALWQWIYPAAAAALVVGLALRSDRIGRAPITAALFYGGTLIPVLRDGAPVDADASTEGLVARIRDLGE